MFNKLFTKILDSSIWLEPTPTRIVWITLLASMDETGFAPFSTIANLANRALVTPEDAERAIDCFVNPDEKGVVGQEFDGRRVERVPGGFIVLNAGKYRAIVNRAEQKEKTRLRVEDYRINQKLKKWGPRLNKTTSERVEEQNGHS